VQFVLRIFNAILHLSNLRFKKLSRKTQNAQRIILILEETRIPYEVINVL